MACKIRLHGTEEEVGKMLFTLEEDEKYKILFNQKFMKTEATVNTLEFI